MINLRILVVCPALHSLSCWLSEGKINGASHCAPMKPAIRINTNRQASKFLEIDRLLDGLEQREQSYM